MRDGVRRAVVSGIDRILVARGYSGLERKLARGDVATWVKARRQRLRTGERSLVGQGVIITAPGRARLRPVEVLSPRSGELTLEVLASGISPGTERAEWLRFPNLQRETPYAAGYSGMGRVLACGAGVDHVAPGMLVAMSRRIPHASLVTTRASSACPVPDGVRNPDAALQYLAVIAGYGVQRAEIAPGESVCVIGAGSIGALAHRMAMLEQPGAVTVVARSRRREEGARRHGASFRTLDDGVDDVGAAVVIEATGDPSAIDEAVRAAAPGGRVVLLGSPWDVTPDVPVEAIQQKELRVIGAHISAFATASKRVEVDPFRLVGERFLAALAAGTFSVDDLAGEVVDPREMQTFYRRLARGEVVGAHLDWTLLPRAERVREAKLFEPPQLPARRPAVHVEAPSFRTPATTTTRFGIVGCGDIGYRNARAVARAGHAEVALAFDPASELSEAVAREFGGAAATSVDDVFDPARVDAVILSVPHDLHTPFIERAADAGVHVVVEKPLAEDLAQASRAVEVAERAGVTLSVFLPYRYEAPVRAARELVRGGALGDVRGAAVLFHDDQPDSYWWGGFSGRAMSDWRLHRKRSGGGVLIMSLIHHIDFIQHVLGVSIESVDATSFTLPGFEVEDEISITATLSGGGIATIFGSTSTRGRPPVHVQLWGDTGTILLQPDPMIYTERAIDGVVPGEWCSLPPDDGTDVRTVFIERFVAALAEGRPPDVPASDGLELQRVIEAAYRSIELGRPMTVREVA